MFNIAMVENQIFRVLLSKETVKGVPQCEFSWDFIPKLKNFRSACNGSGILIHDMAEQQNAIKSLAMALMINMPMAVIYVLDLFEGSWGVNVPAGPIN